MKNIQNRTIFRDDHDHFREQVQRFFKDEISPFHAEWERQGVVPKEVWRKAGRLGLLNTMLPAPYGSGGDFGHAAILIEEIARTGASGLGFPLHSDIVAPYIYRYGNSEQKDKWLPKMAAGDLIGAIAMTEPGAGSDLKAIRTTARRDGDSYVINGQKTFITNGINSEIVIVVAKTSPELGAKGISLFVVEEGAPGFSKGRKLEKIGLLAQDTSELYFDDARVPLENILGEENKGFSYLMHELAQERLVIALRAAMSIEVLLQKTIEYTRDRKAFGQQVLSFQNTKFKLAEAKSQAIMLRVFVDKCIALHMEKKLSPELAAVVKLNATALQNRLLDEFLQLHGGYGYMNEYQIGRAWVDARVGRIYGGSDEIMKEIISRTL